ncbi:MAG: 50S ribosomal protein L21 [Deltaproteobacteria bacterium]|jgi:large subunit ribosomal protein L21|nr:50S ribosomal protein L21 [Deltaproteobacteria bacterium]
MYAILQIGGRQYKVAAGNTIKVDRLPNEIGQEVQLAQVCALGDGGTVTVGHPHLEGVSVVAKVLEHDRAKKILVFKKKRRQGYHKAKGHRQDYTTLRITSILNGVQAQQPSAQANEQLAYEPQEVQPQEVE